MNHYKIGDKVRFKKGISRNCEKGDKGVVIDFVNGSPIVKMESGYTTGHVHTAEHCLEVVDEVKYPNPPHKHAEIIKAWADGAEIEIKSYEGDWLTVYHPSFNGNREYRIKPQLTPQEVEKQAIVDEMAKLQERLDKLEV